MLISDKEKSYYTTLNNINLATLGRLQNNDYYVLCKEKDYLVILNELIKRSGDLINYCLSNKTTLFADESAVQRFLFNMYFNENNFNYAPRQLFYECTFYSKEQPNKKIITHKAILNARLLYGHRICFIDSKNCTQLMTNFLLINNLAKSKEQIIKGNAEQIVDKLEFLTKLRPLFDSNSQVKDNSFNYSYRADHYPKVIKWLKPSEQNPETIQAITNEYILERL